MEYKFDTPKEAADYVVELEQMFATSNPKKMQFRVANSLSKKQKP